ncbi:MAG: heme-binding protein [Acidobacteriota bacterium]|nr:heme-binding protein [Acidobacteriota bacterium]
MSMTADAARELIAHAQEKATEFNKVVAVAVVDAGGFIVAVERQDGARPITPLIAISKAYTAAVMQRPASMLKGWAEHEPVFFAAVSRLGHWPIMATDGAITIKRDGEIVGGLGVAGGRAEEDEQIARAALAAAGYELEFEAWGQKKV